MTIDASTPDYRGPGARVYHNVRECPEGRRIAEGQRTYDAGGLPLCPTCKRMRDDQMRHDTFA